MTFTHSSTKEKKFFAALFFMFMVCNLVGVIGSEHREGVLFHILFAVTLASSFFFILATLDFLQDVLTGDTQVEKDARDEHKRHQEAE